jgi:hypothetical protein
MGLFDKLIVFSLSFILGMVVIYGIMSDNFYQDTDNKNYNLALESNVQEKKFNNERLECNENTSLSNVKKIDSSDLYIDKALINQLDSRQLNREVPEKYVQGY